VPLPAGVLYVVATPIGNLEDLTLRALRILREVDLIAAEDTRRTAKLLAHYQIRQPTISLREHNETREAGRLVERLERGECIALVSDAGTPAVADPGARLVRAAHDRGIRVVPIPGPSAITAALSVAGLALTQFTFMGFPPAGGSERRTWFEALAKEARAVVFFEAPHRIQRTLVDSHQICGIRPIYVFRELSKINEEFVVSPNNANAFVRPRGEFVLVVEPRAFSNETTNSRREHIPELIGRLAKSNCFSSEEMVMILAGVEGISEHMATKAIKKYNISVKRHNQSLA
jgi:16S rRNA (cytidine1402-2'-O)-methyltransferase